jgi:hypothetical protein
MFVRHVFRTIIFASFSLALCATFTMAQSAAPLGDTYSSSANPRTNYGNQPTLIVREGANTYLQFDLSALPSGASVSKATLRLFVDNVNSNGSFDVYPVQTNWSESTLDYNNQPPLGASATGGHPISVNGSNLNDFVMIDVTSLVRQWVNQSVANNGIALVLEGFNGSFSFDSKESTATSHHAELEIAISGAAGPQGPHRQGRLARKDQQDRRAQTEQRAHPAWARGRQHRRASRSLRAGRIRHRLWSAILSGWLLGRSCSSRTVATTRFSRRRAAQA